MAVNINYIIGIDGGGTKTECVLSDSKFNIIDTSFGEASNFLVFGIDKVNKRLYELINRCLKKNKLKFENLSAIIIGTAGAGRIKDAENLRSSFIKFLKSKKINFKNFYVFSDARIALEGAFSGKPGSILIAGTGSIMFGKDKVGKIHRVGGFGRLIGDEGSGYSLGRKGLNAVSKELDGRGKKTEITKLIRKKYKIQSADDLIISVYREKLDIASVVPLVLKAAGKKDAIASKIINEETGELIFHIKAMYEKLNQKILEVSFIGGIVENKNTFSDLLRKKINKELPKIIVTKPQKQPAFGALLLAGERIRNLHNA
jgi:N-acetylglucosamine kinase-like BadF-type ATPase